MSSEKRLEPLGELDLLRKYLSVRAFQWRHSGSYLWLINAPALINTSSPLACAKWAQSYKLDGRLTNARTLNLTCEDATFAALEHKLAPYSEVVVNMRGPLETLLDRSLPMLSSDPAFVMLNPLSEQGIAIDCLQRLVGRQNHNTDLLLNLEASSLERLIDELPHERIDAILGSSLWRKLWYDSNHPERLGQISVLYRASLQRSSYTYAREIALHRTPDQNACSRIVFATRSSAGLALMSDLVCRYHRKELENSPSDISELTTRIQNLGAELGSASPSHIVRTLSPELFGKFTITEYRKAIRGLATRGAIIRADSKRIKDDEPLTFNLTSQMALFGP
jgi:three-Cys-motif partner protein